MRAAITAIWLAACSSSPAVTPDDVATQNGACTALEHRTFTSEAPGECGLGPNGPTSCPWTIDVQPFDAQASTFHWHHSDVEEAGGVSCHGAVLTGRPGASQGMLPGSYDTATHVLVWDGVRYL
ncbi:MAG: hypothetical protein JWO36_2297 [Myxococcales bacterium]|nr:hypothetical protein [Myxococcales bacterium]